MATKSNPLKDFDAPGLVKATQNHEEQLKDLSDRVSTLESLIGNNEAFAKAFVSAQQNDKSIDAALNSVIDAYDNHKIKINALALAKWIFGAIIGAVITWLVTQAVIIPQYRIEIDSLKNQIQTQN